MVITSCICIDILLLLITAVVFLKFYFKKTFNYWKDRGVPTVPYGIPFGNTGNPRTRKDSYYISLWKAYKKLKSEGHKYGGFYMAVKPSLVPIDPELIKNIMSKDFTHFTNRGIYLNRKADPLNANLFFEGGPRWRNLRTKLTPTFSSGKMKMMFNTLLECGKPMEEEIIRLVDTKQAVDIKELAGCYTTDVIGSCAFGLDCSSFKGSNSEFRMYGKKIFEYNSWKTITRTIALISPQLANILGIQLTTKDVTDFFVGVVKSTIDHRKLNKIIRNDFLQLLIELYESGVLSEEEIAPQAYVFFLAGFETSSTTIAHCLYELAKHQDLQEKIRDEIKKCVSDGITYDNLNEMKYLSQTIDETLRMYPVLPSIHRTCSEEYKLPNSNLVIEKDINVMIPVYGLHHDAEYFPDPETFNPDRFSEENKAKIPNFVYLPFGEGPRICIGLRFGVMQTKVALVTMLRGYRVRLNKQTPETLSWNSNGFMLQSNEKIYLDFEKV